MTLPWWELLGKGQKAVVQLGVPILESVAGWPCSCLGIRWLWGKQLNPWDHASRQRWAQEVVNARQTPDGSSAACLAWVKLFTSRGIEQGTLICVPISWAFSLSLSGLPHTVPGISMEGWGQQRDTLPGKEQVLALLGELARDPGGETRPGFWVFAWGRKPLWLLSCTSGEGCGRGKP